MANPGAINSILQQGAAIIVFGRRRPKQGVSPFRRMFCTNSNNILQSMQGRLVLNYRPPSKPPAYNPAQKGLIITWDIMMQDYRMISPENLIIEQEIPDDNFWQYFEKNIYPMTAGQKMGFMNA